MSRRRQQNESLVLASLARAGPVTRAELVRDTGLSRATVAALVEDLLRDGRISENAPTKGPDPRRGRPAAALALTATAGVFVSIALGHDDLRLATATRSGHVLVERHMSLAVDDSAQEALDAVAGQCADALRAIDRSMADVVTVVLGLPAPVDQASGRIMMNNILPGWVNVAPAEELRRRIGLSVIVENDANLAALGEMMNGMARSHRDIILVKASVGIGAGLVLDGRLYRGARGYAGELGHASIQTDGPICRCGSRGCLETQVALPHILAALDSFHGPGRLTAADLVDLVADGDARAIRVLTDAGRIIGRSLADLCNALNPSVLIVSGELSTAGTAFTDGIRETVNRFAQPLVTSSLVITRGALGDRAEVLGGIALAIQATDALNT